MDVEAIIRELTSAEDYGGQIVHVERMAARAARYAKKKPRLPFAVEKALNSQGIERLYSHQAETLKCVDEGKNVVLVSGPASGKSLCYQVPILASLDGNPSQRALLLFPTKALAQDQLRAFERLTGQIGGFRATIGVIDGDTPTAMRRKLCQSGRIVLSNPDFLHASILADHGRWETFFENLCYIVLDELHVYAGLFGSNVGNLFRRLWRLIEHYQESQDKKVYRQDACTTKKTNTGPRVICCSATIANPKELAERIVGRPMQLIEDDGAPRGARTYILWNPVKEREHGRYRRRSANVEAHRIAARLIANQTPTIVFSKCRTTAELIHRYIREELTRMGSSAANKVTPYRGGYLAEERREIERKLFSGELLGVSTTPALELGIDVGALDASIIVGYPGRLASFFQQAGRAGRRDRDSLVVLVFIDTMINQWIAEHPEYLFGRPIEEAVADLDNPHVVAGHLRCAAYELPVEESEEDGFGADARLSLDVLQEKKKVKLLGGRWYHSSSEVPQHEVSLRAFSEANVMIVDADDHDRVLGEVDRYDSYPLVHPGAIYMHLGETYEVEKLDLERNLAFVRKVEVDYYTQPRGGTDVDHIDKALRERRFGTGRAAFGEVTSYFNTFGYDKIRFYSLESVSFHPVQLPVEMLETLSVWIEPTEELMRDIYSRGLDAHAGLRGVGYATRMALPLFVSAETLDFSHSVGSRNCPWHTLFIYERHPKGLGYVEKAYENLEDIIEVVYQRIRDCDCGDGCPCCVGKPLRGSTTWNIERGEGFIPSRVAALRLLEGLLGKREIEIDAADIQPQSAPPETRLPEDEKKLSKNVERAIRRRLERMREAKLLHRVDPRPQAEVDYPDPEKEGGLEKADVEQRVRHRAESAIRKRKRRAREKKIEKDAPKLPEKIDAAQPPEPLPGVGPKNIAAQADDMRRQMSIASRARREGRSKGKSKEDVESYGDDRD